LTAEPVRSRRKAFLTRTASQKTEYARRNQSLDGSASRCRTTHENEPEVTCWRDGALDGARLATARYGKHKFDRHLHDELVIVATRRAR